MAGTHSGAGKTTVATGLMAAFTARGHRVGAAKVGPDFIDPGYHRLATGRVGRNLDVHLSGPDAVRALAARAAEGADLLVVEGVMGLFDGVGATSAASTAEVAHLLEAPVVLVVDAASLSASVAALVHGYDDTLRTAIGRGLAGVVLNRVGSDNHRALLREALVPLGVPVLGTLARDAALAWRDRHLGLVPVVENPAGVTAALRRLAAAVEHSLDLTAIEATARRAPPIAGIDPLPAARPVPGAPVPIAVVAGPAFTFAYPDNMERLAEAGADLQPFDPLEAGTLPAGARALYAGGGYPEVHAEALAANEPLLADVRRRVGGGLVTWAECGGLLWLGQSIEGHRLCGALPVDGRMTGRITVGYRTARALRPNPVVPEGGEVRGHELH
ncbi:MAG: cobyrinate a,c-diamide synthase, partial [Acidimicrobiales bacterium]